MPHPAFTLRKIVRGSIISIPESSIAVEQLSFLRFAYAELWSANSGGVDQAVVL